MSFSLLDKRFDFYSLLLTHFSKWNESVSLLHDIFEDFSDVPAKCKRIQGLESEANEISREIIRQLSLTLIREQERRDIHELNVALQKAITSIKAIATRVGLYGFTEIRSPVRELTSNLMEILIEIDAMLKMLVTRDSIEDVSRRLAKAKEEAGLFLLVALGEIYESRVNNLESVLDIMKWAQIYDRIEEAIENAADVANVIESMILKKV